MIALEYRGGGVGNDKGDRGSESCALIDLASRASIPESSGESICDSLGVIPDDDIVIEVMTRSASA